VQSSSSAAYLCSIKPELTGFREALWRDKMVAIFEDKGVGAARFALDRPRSIGIDACTILAVHLRIAPHAGTKFRRGKSVSGVSLTRFFIVDGTDCVVAADESECAVSGI
jgi:hypothetical protein